MAAKKTAATKQTRGEAPLRRSCGAMAAHMLLMERFPAFHARQFKLEPVSYTHLTLPTICSV